MFTGNAFSLEPIYGKVFNYANKQFEVKYGDCCTGVCALGTKDYCTDIKCSKSYRQDKKDIYLIEIEKVLHFSCDYAIL